MPTNMKKPKVWLVKDHLTLKMVKCKFCPNQPAREVISNDDLRGKNSKEEFFFLQKIKSSKCTIFVQLQLLLLNIKFINIELILLIIILMGQALEQP